MGSTTSLTIFGIPFSKTSGSSHIYNSTKGKLVERDKYTIGPFVWYKRVDNNNNTKRQKAGCNNRKSIKKHIRKTKK